MVIGCGFFDTVPLTDSGFGGGLFGSTHIFCLSLEALIVDLSGTKQVTKAYKNSMQTLTHSPSMKNT